MERRSASGCESHRTGQEGEVAVLDEAVDRLKAARVAVEVLDCEAGGAKASDVIALIRRALVRADLVQVKAAELLGISKSLLQYKLKKYAITGH